MIAGLTQIYRYVELHRLSRANAPMPLRRAGPKVGRNDPCPCGSAKKYKNCCAPIASALH